MIHPITPEILLVSLNETARIRELLEPFTPEAVQNAPPTERESGGGSR